MAQSRGANPVPPSFKEVLTDILQRLSAVNEERSNMEQAMAEMKPNKSDINLVIMDYLISEGYPGAAEKFAQEAGLFQEEDLDTDSIRERVDIRNAILTGRIESAIDLVNDLDAQLLDNNAVLHFKLLQLQLIELIRPVTEGDNNNPPTSDFKPALEFATTQLAPRAPTDQKYLSALEKTMALMLFSPEKRLPEMKELMDLELRETVAADVNKAILENQGLKPEARIRELVRARAWAEEQARSAKVDLPPDVSLGLDIPAAGGDVMVV